MSEQAAATGFAVVSNLLAPADVVWRHATTAYGINREFAPFLRMTFPSHLEVVVPERAAASEPSFRSWILFLGILPVDYDDLTFVEIEPGRRFLERSQTSSQRVWEHERVVEARDHGCQISDRIRFVPRLPVLAPIHQRIFVWTFRWRHRNLRRLFGNAAPKLDDRPISTGQEGSSQLTTSTRRRRV